MLQRMLPVPQEKRLSFSIAVEVLPHASVNDHDSCMSHRKRVCDPLMLPVAVPLMSHEPLSPLEYASEVPVGGAALHEMVMLDVAANVACAAGETVIVLEAVEVLPHASVNDHDSVYEPPQEVVRSADAACCRSADVA
jgi:hypothetical protein